MPVSQVPSAAIQMRPARAEDAPLLFDLFAAEKRVELVMTGVPSMQAELLVQMQYRGRAMTYAAQYPQAEQWILCDSEGIPAGHLLLDRQPKRWRIVDIAVVAAHRGRGVATWALRQVQEQCSQQGASLELSVTPQNPARRLYERLGFYQTQESASAVEMVWNGT